MEQLDALAGAKDPAAHAAQPIALVVPGLTIVPAKPGAQIAQASTDTLLVPDVYVPTGQATQPDLSSAR
jgi:hypothetical protein